MARPTTRSRKQTKEGPAATKRQRVNLSTEGRPERIVQPHAPDAPKGVIQNGAVRVKVESAAPQAGLWFDDGTVVVHASDGVSFKLHAGLLSRQSVPLAALITAARQAVPVEGSLVGPVVHLPDKAEHLLKFFVIIHDGAQHSFFDCKNDVEFRELRAILLLAIRYEVRYIVKQGMARLKACFPPDLNRLPAWRETQPTVIMDNADALAAALLVRAAGDEELLPTILYACSGLPPMAIVHGMRYGDEEVKLSHQDQQRCLEAIPQLLAMRGRIVNVFLRGSLHDLGEEPGPCVKRGVCRKIFHLLAMQAAKDQIYATTRCFSSLRPWVDKALQAMQQQLCINCKEALRQQLTMDTHSEWCELGKTFGLPDWIPYGRD